MAWLVWACHGQMPPGAFHNLISDLIEMMKQFGLGCVLNENRPLERLLLFRTPDTAKQDGMIHKSNYMAGGVSIILLMLFIPNFLV